MSAVLSERSPNKHLSQPATKTDFLTKEQPIGEKTAMNSNYTSSSTDPSTKHKKTTTTTTETQAEAQAQTYVSPSDSILSPMSKKLSEMKGKRFANAKPQTLFAKTVSKEGLKNQERLNKNNATTAASAEQGAERAA